MHRRFVGWVAVAVVSYLILTKTTILSSLWALFFLGLIPATTIYIPWWILAFIYLIVLWAGLFWLNAQPVTTSTPARSRKSAKRSERIASSKRRASTSS